MRHLRQQSARATYGRLGAFLLLPLLAVAGCSSGPSSTKVNNTTYLYITPLANPTVGTGEQVLITAGSYTATDTALDGVLWTITCSPSSTTNCGSLNTPTLSNVVYIAPSAVSAPITVTVTATSVSNPSVSASITFPVVTSVFTLTSNLGNGPFTLPASGSVTFTSSLNPNPGLTNTLYSVTGTSCSGSTCGTFSVVSGSNGTSDIFIPAGFATQQTLTVTAVPAADPAISQSITFTVPPNVDSLTLSPAILPIAIAGATAYSQTVTISGGTAPYTVNILASTVPTWITSLTTAGNPGVVTTVTLNGSSYYQFTSKTGQFTVSGSVPVPTTSVNTTTAQRLPASASELQLSIADSSGITSTNGLGVDIYTTPGTSNALLNGNYVFSGLGFQDGSTIVNAERVGYIGTLTADGNGDLTGYMDVNETSGASSVKVRGNYAMYSTQTGFLTLHNDGNSPTPIVFAITLGGVGSNGSASRGSFVEYDDTGGNNGNIPKGLTCCGGTRASGLMLQQSSSVLNAAANQLVGSYAFAMNGRNPYSLPGMASPTAGTCLISSATALPTCGPAAAAGSVTFSATGAVTAGEQDITQGNTSNTQVGIGGTGLAQSGKTDAYGRVAANITATTGSAGLNDWPSNYIIYEVNPSTFFAMSTDPYSSYTLLEGEGQVQNMADIAALPFSGLHNIVVYGSTVNTQNYFLDTTIQATSINGASTAAQQLLTPVPSGTTAGTMSGSEFVELGGATNGFISNTSTGTAASGTAPATSGGAIASFTYNVDSFGRVTNNSAYYGQAANAPLGGNDPQPNEINVPNLYLTDTDSGIGIGIGLSGPGIFVVQQQTIIPGQALSAGTYSWFNSFPNAQTAPLEAGSITVPAGGVPNNGTNVNITGESVQSYFSTTYDESDGGPLLFATPLTGTMQINNSQLTGFTFGQSGFQGCSNGDGFVVTPTEFLCFPNSTGYTSVQVFRQ